MSATTPHKAVILMYHRIAEPALDPWGLCVGPGKFSEQLEQVKRLAQPIALADYVRATATNELPERCVVVTFDDGYLDNHDLAMPLLQRHRVPATLFVTTGNIDSEREFWWDQLETLLLAADVLPGRLELDAPNGRIAWDLGPARVYNAEQRQADIGVNAWQAKAGTRLAFYYDVWKTLWPLEPAVRDSAVDAVAEWSGAGSAHSGSRRTVTSTELRAMAQSGWMTIGAHSIDHLPLPAHPVGEQARQIHESKRRLQDIIGAPVTSFAYPHGDHGPDTVGLLRDSGFDCAVTVQQRLAHGRTDPMRLPRFGVGNIDGESFGRQLEAWFELPLIASDA